MNIAKVISTESGALGKRLVKVLRFGKSDVQTPSQAAPHGIDSNPVAGMAAVFCETGMKGKPVVLGYVNRDQQADIGEIRIYSTDENGVQQTYLWLKNNGTMEVGGNADFMVRFNELKAGFDELKADFNTHISVYNAHTHVYSPGPGTPAPTATPVAQDVASTASIDAAKIEEIKTL